MCFKQRYFASLDKMNFRNMSVIQTDVQELFLQLITIK